MLECDSYSPSTSLAVGLRSSVHVDRCADSSSQAMTLGESVGVFPEGTSHTEPHMIPIKDGMSWAALEYVRYLAGTEENGGPKKGKKCVVVPVALAYVDKSKYRSRVAVQ